jgi:hypothetical protein
LAKAKFELEDKAVSDDISETPEERRGRFLRWAAKAHESAAKAPTPEARTEFMIIAESWKAMAERVGQQAESEKGDSPQ